MVATSFTPSSCSSFWLCKTRPTTTTKILEPCLSPSLSSSARRFRYPKLPCFLALSASFSISHSSKLLASSSSPRLWPTISNNSRLSSVSVFALVNEKPPVVTMSAGYLIGEDGSVSKNLLRPCDLYVCNLPRSCGISELLEMFQPYGTVQSVEVSRNAETGISRGCGYITMSSIDEAKAAIAALDGSDVGEREMRVVFSADMNTKSRFPEEMNSKPEKNLIFESPYKVYVGNLAWPVKPEHLKSLFSQFGTVNSARVLYDRKGGKNRVYGFLSFSSPAECEAAISLNGADFFGRTLIVREVPKQNGHWIEF